MDAAENEKLQLETVGLSKLGKKFGSRKLATPLDGDEL